mmetsp:Transcript_1822/g.4316  ORF Transcript_1822/g.4316 Transcript_1822/m.4316 type:complete len:329 (+) Transcript_1822:40-1026(+)
MGVSTTFVSTCHCRCVQKLFLRLLTLLLFLIPQEMRLNSFQNQRKEYLKLASLSILGLDSHMTSQDTNELLRNGQAETRSPVALFISDFDLEGLKDSITIIGVNSLPIILDGKLEEFWPLILVVVAILRTVVPFLFHQTHAEIHKLAFAAKFNGIAQQVVQYLLQPSTVHSNVARQMGRQVGTNFHPIFVPRLRFDGKHDRVDRRPQMRRVTLNVDPSGGQFGIIEHVIDHGQEQITTVGHHFEWFLDGFFHSIAGFNENQVGQADNAIERSSYFVTHHGELSYLGLSLFRNSMLCRLQLTLRIFESFCDRFESVLVEAQLYGHGQGR